MAPHESDLDWFNKTFRLDGQGACAFAHVQRPVVGPDIKCLDVSGTVDVVVMRGDEPGVAIACAREEDARAVKVEYDEDEKMLLLGQSGTVISVAGQGVVICGDGSIIVGGQGNNVVASGGSIAAGGSVTVSGNILRTSGDAVAVIGPVLVGLIVPELFEIQVRGAGSVTFRDVRQSDLKVRASGVGAVRVQGHVDHLDVKVSGTGSVEASRLEATSARLRLSGAGDIRAHVIEDVDAKVSGVGDILITGNPARRRERVSGVGDIEFI